MAKEKLLVATRDNNIIVIDLEYQNSVEKARKTLECKNFCENNDHIDIINMYNAYVNNPRTGSPFEEILKNIDGENTAFVNNEIAKFDYVKRPSDYESDLERNDFSSDVMQQNVVHFNYMIPNSVIPEMIKNLGYKIKATDELYNVRYDSQRREYFVENFSRRRATVYYATRKIEWARKHFKFPPQEYNQLQVMISDFNNARQINRDLDIFEFANRIRDEKKRSLFNLYATEVYHSEHRELSLLHELKHIKNSVFEDGISLKKDAKRLSVEDYYRLEVEDERSSYLSQAINAINKYLIKGDLNDFSMFDGECKWLVQRLKSLPEPSRQSLVMNYPEIIKGAFDTFNREHKKDYDEGQFKRNLLSKMDKISLSAQEDINHAEFYKIQSLFYNYKIYNPVTRQMEYKNLGRFIDSSMQVTITPNVYTEIIKPSKIKLNNRISEYEANVRRGSVNPNLIEEAKKLKRDNLRKPRYIAKVDDLEISELVNSPDTSESIPADKIDWSNNLCEYWKNFDGYSELERNNLEYRFKINNDIISYSAQNKVSVSRDAEYDTYIKMINEPSSKNRTIKFKDTLTKEQALKLYIACINNGRKVVGKIPTDLSQVDNLKNIPSSEVDKFKRLMGSTSQSRNSQRSSASTIPISRRLNCR